MCLYRLYDRILVKTLAKYVIKVRNISRNLRRKVMLARVWQRRICDAHNRKIRKSLVIFVLNLGGKQVENEERRTAFDKKLQKFLYI